MALQANTAAVRFRNFSVQSTTNVVSSVFTSIPEEVLQYLSLKDIASYSRVCKGSCRAVDRQLIWRYLLEKDFGKEAVLDVQDGDFKEAYKDNFQKFRELETYLEGLIKPEDRIKFPKEIQRGNRAYVRFLIEEFHLDVNAYDIWGKTLSHYVAEGGNLNLMRELVEKYHLDVNAIDRRGRTGLHYAARSGKMSIVQYLIEKLCLDINAIDQCSDLTVLFCAKRNNQGNYNEKQALIQYIQAHMLPSRIYYAKVVSLTVFFALALIGGIMAVAFKR